MILTEQEAKEKWCCIGHANPGDWLKCFGSKCMAWRLVLDDDGSRMKKVGEEYFDVGYCGLAGKPQ